MVLSVTSPAAGPVLSVVRVSCTSTAQLKVSLGEPWWCPSHNSFGCGGAHGVVLPSRTPLRRRSVCFGKHLPLPGAAEVSLVCGAVVARGSPRLEPFAPFAGKRPCGGSAISPQPPVPPTAPARCTGPQQPPQHVWLWDSNPGSRSPFQALWSEGVLGTSQLSAGWWDGKLVPKGAGPFSSWSWLPLAFDGDLCLCLVVADLDRSRAPPGAFHLQRYPLRRGRLLCQSRCCYKVVKTMLGRRTCQKEEPDEASAEGR